MPGRDTDRVADAVARSFLADMPAATLARLTAGVMLLDLPAGSAVYREGDAPRLGIVEHGLVRIFITSPDGRQRTIRYARAGDVVGLATVVGGPVDVGAQAIASTALAMLNADLVRSTARADSELAWAVAEELGRRLFDIIAAFAADVSGSVRQRLARHLLDLAAEAPLGADLIAPVTQQALADAVGTAREVVARAMHDLREEGLVENAPNGIRLVDPDRLGEIAGTAGA
jgi:CRP/FNR family transcriptional regulator, cyclic AMP receptor protein